MYQCNLLIKSLCANASRPTLKQGKAPYKREGCQGTSHISCKVWSLLFSFFQPPWVAARLLTHNCAQAIQLIAAATLFSKSWKAANEYPSTDTATWKDCDNTTATYSFPNNVF